jgi:hypothetical protein
LRSQHAVTRVSGDWLTRDFVWDVEMSGPILGVTFRF